MNNLEKTLITEYKRLCEAERSCADEHSKLPAGYIQKKNIKGKEYYYLQFRVGNKVKSVYVKKNDLRDTTEKIEKRKELERELTDIRNQKKSIESIIDKDTLNLMIIKEAACKVAKKYPFITRIALFGSRAGTQYRDDSDVDLIFEATEPVSFMKQAEIRMLLEEELGMSVDFVHGPLPEQAFLEIGKEIELYAA